MKRLDSSVCKVENNHLKYKCCKKQKYGCADTGTTQRYRHNSQTQSLSVIGNIFLSPHFKLYYHAFIYYLRGTIKTHVLSIKTKRIKSLILRPPGEFFQQQSRLFPERCLSVHFAASVSSGKYTWNNSTHSFLYVSSFFFASRQDFKKADIDLLRRYTNHIVA